MTSDAQTARIAELEADVARLRRLLEQRDAPAELRHRLRGLVGLMRSIIRQSARTRSVDDYAAHMEDRLDALTRIQGAIDLSGEIDLHTMIADEFTSYATQEGDRLSLTGPEVLLQPNAGQVMGLAFHELAVNAVEHGGLLTPEGKIAVSWRLDPGDSDPSLVLTWTETGAAAPVQPSSSGFGTEVLTDMVQHALKAKTNLAYEPDGLRYALSFPLPSRIGRLAGTG